MFGWFGQVSDMEEQLQFHKEKTQQAETKVEAAELAHAEAEAAATEVRNRAQ
jgi:hypothetical protein